MNSLQRAFLTVGLSLSLMSGKVSDALAQNFSGTLTEKQKKEILETKGGVSLLINKVNDQVDSTFSALIPAGWEGETEYAQKVVRNFLSQLIRQQRLKIRQGDETVGESVIEGFGDGNVFANHFTDVRLNTETRSNKNYPVVWLQLKSDYLPDNKQLADLLQAIADGQGSDYEILAQYKEQENSRYICYYTKRTGDSNVYVVQLPVSGSGFSDIVENLARKRTTKNADGSTTVNEKKVRYTNNDKSISGNDE